VFFGGGGGTNFDAGLVQEIDELIGLGGGGGGTQKVDEIHEVDLGGGGGGGGIQEEDEIDEVDFGGGGGGGSQDEVVHRVE
jgi:hypothetical protein